VKDAGFAPIFVLDELDKVEDAWEALHRFLTLTKHIVTDQSAFMFLTNRDYYEKLGATEQEQLQPETVGREQFAAGSAP